MVAIVDYNMGNLASVFNACKLIGVDAHIVSNPDELKNYGRVILPGVGAFGDAMEHLESTGMKKAVLDFAASGKPIIGICLGMQLLFESSEEFGDHKGLGLIPGKVIAFDKSKMNMEEHKVPHVGWNKLFNKPSPLFNTLTNPYLYFVHSFHAVTDNKYIIGRTHYGYDFTSAVNKDNIYGFQPHPEKSHDNGIQILKNFMEI
ncbi:MAG: imidazole glycerol phosphate synthase subunit HisH [Campylobacteraceae bacterium]|nr:imidazole glycerol phosphate synthase subunit HisH [Campylobacteraceae bacterium]MBT3882134.1 imidazole glycerol phosphate synthase subunit HisH [Campylobacteraceae bacterium]MBT4031142.1 imidazole glycerol phosphate synthase subunit HisH [Campylobacteraceae bacterium]MBT4178841.1 imidazole glycerol phosphate synthase subunit HisH [Campylobacteraceae bacterium]MBT4572070.1 imidazole glycerol phosphate synthase subunit HisH [Campylobacteraceae bacterium]